MKIRFGVFSFFALCLGAAGCTTKEELPPIGQRISGPTDVETSPGEDYFYVLNSDFERKYGEGSILVLSPDGTKVNAVPVPRMGRSIEIVDQTMIAAFDKEDLDGAEGKVQIYDLADPSNPVLKQSWDLECSPLNAVARSGYQYFAVACDGDMYIGTFGSPLETSTLTRVRSYGYLRRALYIDPARGLLLAFPTDISSQTQKDTKYEDKTGFGFEDEELAEENETPDELEKTRRLRSNRSTWRTYQYIVYDIAAEAAKGFPYKSVSDDNDLSVEAEHRWVYFTLANLDGTPDSDEGALDPTVKHYRTNFWMAKEDLSSDGSFYLSHRGFDESVNANNIVKVDIVGDLHATTKDGDCPANRIAVGTLCVPKTSGVLSFSRAYGFAADKLHYPGDFEIKYVAGQPLLAVNHFRDPIFFKKEDRSFSIAATVLGEGTWSSELRTTSFTNSYYQIAVNSSGQAVTGSFYGDSILMLNITPGQDIEIVQKVK
ncbi:MAG: hypothetical protein AB7T49_03275 [Oligoflexales bacterium]